VALSEESYPEAQRLLSEGLELGRQMQNDRITALCLQGLGRIACREGELALAEQILLEGGERIARSRDRKAKAEGLEALAELRARQGRTEDAVALYAEAETLREAIGAPLPPCDAPRLARDLTALRATLGPQRFEAIWVEARSRAAGECLTDILEPIH
jgi:hypothetical protein